MGGGGNLSPSSQFCNPETALRKRLREKNVATYSLFSLITKSISIFPDLPAH